MKSLPLLNQVWLNTLFVDPRLQRELKTLLNVQISSLYHFIGVTERFDESLIVSTTAIAVRHGSVKCMTSMFTGPQRTGYETRAKLDHERHFALVQQSCRDTGSRWAYSVAKREHCGQSSSALKCWFRLLNRGSFTSHSQVQDYGRGVEFYSHNRLDFMLHAHVRCVTYA